MSIVLLGTKRGEKFSSTKGQIQDSLQQRYTRLTPSLLQLIPDSILPLQIKDRIVLPEGSVMVDREVLAEGLKSLAKNTPVIEAEVGAEFRTLTGPLSTLDDVVLVIRQALAQDLEATGPLENKIPVIEAEVGANFRNLTGPLSTLDDVVLVIRQALAQDLEATGSLVFVIRQPFSRSVSIWLDRIDRPDYPQALGIIIRINRYYNNSLQDYIRVWVPLGITVTDVNEK